MFRAGGNSIAEVTSVRGNLQISGFLAVLAVAMAVPGLAGASIVQNGSFEQTSFPVADDSFAAGAVRTTDPGVEVPKVLKEVRPTYTAEAMRRRVEGVVLLDVVVEPDGSVGRVRIKTPLHPDLDHSAIVAARQWRFTPPTKDGVPVAMLVDLSLNFTIFVRR